MISNNDDVKIFTIKYDITDSAPSKHNEYFNESTISFKYFFMWRYVAGFFKDIPFRANKS